VRWLASGAGRAAVRKRMQTSGRFAPEVLGLMEAVFYLVGELLNLYKWAVILSAVFSMLVSFNVLDTRNRIVWSIGDFLYRVTEPALRPIRRILPNFGSIDVSPVILIVVIQALQILLSSLERTLIFNGLFF
jgi:YggT family protein